MQVATTEVTLVPGTNISLGRTDNQITINSTGTTYSVGDGGLTQNNFTNTLKSKLDGIASRVPVPDGSVVDLFLELEKEVTTNEINEAVKEAANTERMKNVLFYSENPIVSSDIIGNPYSSIYDSKCTKVKSGKYVRTLNWYDNEWGYSNRVVDLIKLMCN